VRRSKTTRSAPAPSSGAYGANQGGRRARAWLAASGIAEGALFRGVRGTSVKQIRLSDKQVRGL